ncbi:MAG: hypothetical protein IID50_00660 [Proteobacteria bacterium]|nr:hypothetical protein [Pseudomonadota bacterium]
MRAAVDRVEDLRPGAPEWGQAVDDHYAGLAEILETMDPDGRARFEDDYARATGVLPGPVLKRLRAGLLSADPAGQAFAATRLDRLKDADPDRIAIIPEDERRRARIIAGFADLGLPPARAVELAEEKLAQRVLPTEDLTGGATERILVAAAGDEDIVRDMVLRREDRQGVVGPLGPARPIDEGSRDAQPLAERADKGGEALENKGTGEDGHGGGEGAGEDDTAAGKGEKEPDPTAGAEEQAAPGATRGERPDQSRRSVEDLRRLYREREIPDDVARTLAKTGVVPRVEPKLDGKKVELIRAVRDLDPEDEKAVKALRKRIRRELGRSRGIDNAFQLEVTARIGGRDRDASVGQLVRFAVIEFGREIDPENAKLLAAVLEATPENLKDVLGRINRRFDGLSGGSGAYKQTLRGVIEFKQTGGKRGLSPKAAAKQLMPYVDGSIAEVKKKIAKTAIGAVALGPGLILKLIGIINSGDSILSLSGTQRQRKRAIERIGGK